MPVTQEWGAQEIFYSEALASEKFQIVEATKAKNLIERIWKKDHTVWREDPQEIDNRLDWLGLPEETAGRLAEIENFAEEQKTQGVEDVVLLGMGGSSLCPLVFSLVVGNREGYPRLHVLDSTVPEWVARVSDSIHLKKTLFIVASKSGGTIEVMSAFNKFWEDAHEQLPTAGQAFIAITDPDTSLSQLADQRGFLRTFTNNPNVGGRFSALSFFGMVPAALLGVDAKGVLSQAEALAEACRGSEIETNPGAELGVFLAVCSSGGRNKLTLLSSQGLESLGLWIEQLIAESTGKEDRGILPIAEEPTLPLEVYGHDRAFAVLRRRGDTALDPRISDLKRAGHPVIVLDFDPEIGLGAEFFRWEFATAFVSHFLDIHPFDQPNVQLSKTKTSEVLAKFENEGVLELPKDGDAALSLLAAAGPGSYVALMGYVDESPAVEKAVADLRRAISEKTGAATTFGYGPRFLHSTGQYHKGGPNEGVFIQLIAKDLSAVSIPGKGYDFSVLCRAQALGDFQALESKGRKVACITLVGDPAEKIAELTAKVRAL
jgi:glucose-6-phosphate isomerase/transaldolase/glucose-6-phosphate isomerase